LNVVGIEVVGCFAFDNIFNDSVFTLPVGAAAPGLIQTMAKKLIPAAQRNPKHLQKPTRGAW
jgi:hypothetical protein